jgi:hypothetical protein
MLFSLLMASAAFAQDCDVRTMSKEIVVVGPHEAAPMFVQLAQCDGRAAAGVAGKVIPTLIGESEGFDAALAAIEVGAGASVMAWMPTFQRDEMSRAIRAFGKRCQESEGVQGFLIEAHEILGDKFWTDRWYRALTECRTDAITGLLAQHVDAGAGEDRGAFFGVIEAYATNAGPAAVGKLVSMVEAEDDIEMQINLINAFSDAAQAGTVSGLNPETASIAAAALRALGPKLPTKAVEQARITLSVLQDEEGSDKLVVHRFKDVAQEDGTLLYGTVVYETATCKNGKLKQRYHVAEALDPGQTWPDQLEDRLKSTVEINWKLNLAHSCKGEGEIKYLTPSAPFADEAGFKLWVKKVIRENTSPNVKKATRIDEDPIEL